ncbi:MAG: phosphate/phosphite/phosphonate ABC transporter substrate-binding protein [Pseudomonadota bacterium]
MYLPDEPGASRPMLSRLARQMLLSAVIGVVAFGSAASAQATDKLRFVTGPFRATEAETRAAWGPLFKYLGEQLGVESELTILDNWNKVNAAMAKDEYDAAWMGGAGRYVIVRSQGGGPAIATVKVAGSPVYHALFLARPGLEVKDFPRGAKDMSLSFTHENSTTGWLVQYAWLVSQGIDPKTWFKYTATNQHADNITGLAKGQFDLATDSDANRNAMIARGAAKDSESRILWTSPDVPQDPIQVRNGLDPALTKRLQAALVAIDDAKAKSIPMPPNYTGFVTTTDADYKSVHDASVLVGRIKKP